MNSAIVSCKRSPDCEYMFALLSMHNFYFHYYYGYFLYFYMYFVYDIIINLYVTYNKSGKIKSHASEMRN